MTHGHEADFAEARENRKTIFMGLGAALVWLLIVGSIAHFLARSMSGGEEAHGPAAPAAPAAATQQH